MVYGFYGGALVFSDYLLAVFGDLFGEVRLSETLLDCLEQFLPVFDHNGTFTFEKCVHGLFEIEGMWAEDGAFAKSGSFGHIGATHWYE